MRLSSVLDRQLGTFNQPVSIDDLIMREPLYQRALDIVLWRRLAVAGVRLFRLCASGPVIVLVPSYWRACVQEIALLPAAESRALLADQLRLFASIGLSNEIA